MSIFNEKDFSKMKSPLIKAIVELINSNLAHYYGDFPIKKNYDEYVINILGEFDWHRLKRIILSIIEKQYKTERKSWKKF